MKGPASKLPPTSDLVAATRECLRVLAKGRNVAWLVDACPETVSAQLAFSVEQLVSQSWGATSVSTKRKRGGGDQHDRTQLPPQLLFLHAGKCGD